MTTVRCSAASRRGRPRSEQADEAIIEATLDLLAEGSTTALSIEAIASRAGVGKATIYRRWPGKDELLLDALRRSRRRCREPAGDSVRDDLVALLGAMRSESVDPRQARQFALLLGEGARYPRLMERYVETVVEPRRDVFRAVLRRGVATGELRENVSIEMAVDMLTGAVLAKTTRLSQERADRAYGRRVVDELLTGIASR